MQNEILAYTAGLIDGEGCICISMNKPSNKNGLTLDNHFLRVRIAITDKEVVEWLKNTFGGFTSNNSNCPSKRKHWKVLWVWCISSIQAKDFLKMIYPYLRIKKKQAELAIRFRENKKDMLNQKRDFQIKEVNQRDWYRQEISKLNQGSDT